MKEYRTQVIPIRYKSLVVDTLISFNGEMGETSIWVALLIMQLVVVAMMNFTPPITMPMAPIQMAV